MDLFIESTTSITIARGELYFVHLNFLELTRFK